MGYDIDLNSIKNGFYTAYHTASAKTSEWTGRAMAIIKSNTETALPYLQDKRIAAASLVAVNLILIQLGDFSGRFVNNRLPQRTEGQRAFGQTVELIIGLGTVIGGVYAFSKHTNLPFTPLAITGISVGTLAVRTLLQPVQ